MVTIPPKITKFLIFVTRSNPYTLDTVWIGSNITQVKMPDKNYYQANFYTKSQEKFICRLVGMTLAILPLQS